LAAPESAGRRIKWTMTALVGRQDVLDDLLAVLDFYQEAFTRDFAILVPGDIHKHAGMLGCRKRYAVRGLNELLLVELAYFFGDVFDGIGADIAFDGVVVRTVVELLLEFLGHFVDGLDIRIGRQTDMAERTIRG